MKKINILAIGAILVICLLAVGVYWSFKLSSEIPSSPLPDPSLDGRPSPTAIESLTSPSSTPSEVFCTQEWDPVCGTDGETYSNECAAGAAGINIARAGECASGEPILDNNSSENGLKDIPTASSSVPSAICPEEYTPVCGMDATTYKNACYAKQQGVIVAFEGECVWVIQDGTDD